MIRTYRGVLPRIAVSAYVDPSAQVIGDVVVGERMLVPPASVAMGVPARIRRPVSEKEEAI